MAEFDIREALAEDAAAIRGLLEACGLGRDSILAPGTRYWLAEDRLRAVVGVVGVEYGDGAALLRSAGVRPDVRGRGLGGELVRRALAATAADGLEAVYLFSTDAGSYWQRQGFYEVPVPELTAALPRSPQVLHYEELGWLPTEVAWRLDLRRP